VDDYRQHHALSKREGATDDELILVAFVEVEVYQ